MWLMWRGWRGGGPSSDHLARTTRAASGGRAAHPRSWEWVPPNRHHVVRDLPSRILQIRHDVTEPISDPAAGGQGGALDWGDPSALPVEAVRDVFLTLTKALRAYQLYDSNNPVYQRFVANLRESFRALWETRDKLELLVDEYRVTWLGEEIYRNDNRSESLAFVFYRDGIRELTLRKGIEAGEMEVLLDALHRAKNVRGEGDDLVTILWDLDLKLLSYGAVDLFADGVEVLGPVEPMPPLNPRAVLEGENLVPLQGVRAVGTEEEEEADASGEGTGSSADEAEAEQKTVSKEDFNPTLYAMEPKEQEYLRGEVEKEMRRDLRGAVIHALLDRLEEPGNAPRQVEILTVLRTLLPNFLSQGALGAASEVVEELLLLQQRHGVLAREADEVREKLLDDLSSPESVSEIVRSIEDGTFPPDARELQGLLRHLRAGALSPLLQGVERAATKDTQRLLREAVKGIAEANRDAVMRLLNSADATVLIGAIRMVGQLGITDAAGALARLLEHRDPQVRRAAVEVAEQVPSSALAGALQRVLTGEDRDLSIAAARALGATGYVPAAGPLRELIESKEVRGADIQEKLPYFEAFGRVGGEEGVAYLARLLNGKGFLGRREASDVRACAALGLGRAGLPSARQALESAKGESDPVVRSAVNRALRGGEVNDG